MRERGTNHFGAVFDGLFGVEGAGFARDALADDAGGLVNEDGGRGRRRRREVADAVAAGCD